MKNKKIETKRMYEIENLILSNNKSNLSGIELEYFNLAIKMPIEEIKELLDLYDTSSPKLDELKFIIGIQKKYSETWENVIKRIQQVRRITTYKKGLEEGKKLKKTL